MILEKYANKIWFGMSCGHTYLWLGTIDPDTFKMRQLPYYVYEKYFHKEVLSRPGVKCIQKEDEIIYNLDCMQCCDSFADVVSSSKK